MQGINNAELLRKQCYIAGKWVAADSKKTIIVTNPFNDKTVGTVPLCGKVETERAIAAADSAFEKWRELTAKQRQEKLFAWAQLIDNNKADLATIMTLEQGKPLTEAMNEMDYANNFIKWFAEEGKRIYGDVIPANKTTERILVFKQPIGVVGAITPWNFPAAMITRKIAPALAAGCTVVVKPASETPLTALALGFLAEKAGIPAGVINIITGDAKEIGKELTSNPLVKKVSFTGSTQVGKLLMAQSASTIKKVSLELGGNAPFIVFADADLDAAVTGMMASKFRNTGQTCVCANRILVEDSIYDVFSKKLLVKIKELKLGDGLQEGVSQGPLINMDAIKKVEAHIADAVNKGGKIIYGGKRSPIGNLFFEPTVIIDATENMQLAQEETFGPVAALFRFQTEEAAIKLANATPYGLSAYFYSKQIDRIFRVMEKLESGIVGVNTGIISNEVAPFGGVKQSGIGREGSKYGIEEYVELKYVCLNIHP